MLPRWFSCAAKVESHSFRIQGIIREGRSVWRTVVRPKTDKGGRQVRGQCLWERFWKWHYEKKKEGEDGQGNFIPVELKHKNYFEIWQDKVVAREKVRSTLILWWLLLCVNLAKPPHPDIASNSILDVSVKVLFFFFFRGDSHLSQ